MEEIRALAEQLDKELITLEESHEKNSPSLPTDWSFSMSSFENAVAESEKESLQDTISELTTRTEELEDRVLHQNFIIEMLKTLNDKLYERVGVGDEILNMEIEKLNEILMTYNQNSIDLDEIPPSQTNSLKSRTYKSNLRLTVQLGEMQITESKLRGTIASLNSKLEDYQRAKLQLERERTEERLKRIEAESQWKAYAIAYQDTIRHLKKITASAQSTISI